MVSFESSVDDRWDDGPFPSASCSILSQLCTLGWFSLRFDDDRLLLATTLRLVDMTAIVAHRL